ncbi:MAG: hypothetical protein H5T50_03855 [Nitrososphaeria archaeon]|nr:hypothetical protein [Nitrososphaeria archaeon]
MVDLLERLEDLKEHATYCREILYKVEDCEKGKRVRIRTGRFGWDGIISEDEYKKLECWLKTVNACKVISSVPDGVFFL